MMHPGRDVTPQAILMASLLLLSLAACGASELAGGEPTRRVEIAQSKGPLIGAIRFDYWFRASNFGPLFAHAELDGRTPWYGAQGTPMRLWPGGLDDQKVMDRDVADMQEAGIHWVLQNWMQKPAEGLTIMDNFLRALDKTSMRYAVQLHPLQAAPASYTASRSEREWQACRDDLVRKHLARHNYLRVNGRPVVFLFAWDKWEQVWGSAARARQELAALVEQCRAAGLPAPYFVLQTWLGHSAGFAKIAQSYGVDAFSAYAHSGPEDYDQVAEGHPYTEAMARDARWRDEYAANSLGLPIIPNVMTGWDPRPHWVEPQIAAAHYPYAGMDYYHPATPQQIVDNVKGAVSWLETHPQTFNAVLIYAWNEVIEGGWLMETKLGGRARIDAMRRAFNPTHGCNPLPDQEVRHTCQEVGYPAGFVGSYISRRSYDCARGDYGPWQREDSCQQAQCAPLPDQVVTNTCQEVGYPAGFVGSYISRRSYDCARGDYGPWQREDSCHPGR